MLGFTDDSILLFLSVALVIRRYVPSELIGVLTANDHVLVFESRLVSTQVCPPSNESSTLSMMDCPLHSPMMSNGILIVSWSRTFENHDFGVGSEAKSVSLLAPPTAAAGGGGAAAPPAHQPYGLKVVHVAPKLVAVTKRIKARKTNGRLFFINCLLSASFKASS
jgi:hypothetical protein